MEWINVENKLPERKDERYTDQVLVHTHTGLVQKGFMIDDRWERVDSAKSFKESGYDITHWMPIPESPED